MFLEIESNGHKRKLLNVTLIDKVELNDTDEIAECWAGGVLIVSSKVAYKFYVNRPDDLVTKMPEPKPVQSGITKAA